MKFLWFDTETTGLDCNENDIIQLSGLIIVNGVIKDEFNFKIAPINVNAIDKEAIKVHGITIEEMMKFPDALKVKQEFTNLLSKYVDKYNREDKFIPAGYNVRFDMDFLNSFFKKCGDAYLFSFINGYALDLYPLALGLHYMGIIPKLTNFKLETITKHFGIEMKAHDALEDIKATQLLYEKLRSLVLEYDPQSDFEIVDDNSNEADVEHIPVVCPNCNEMAEQQRNPDNSEIVNCGACGFHSEDGKILYQGNRR